MHTLLCVCPPRVESLFPPVLSKSCNQIPLAFKVCFSGNSSSLCWTPRLGRLTWGWEPSLQWVDFCGIIVLQFVSQPPSGYGIWFYCDCAPPTISLRLLLCLWMWGIFLVSSSVFLSMTVQQLFVIPVLSQEGMSRRPSTPPSSIYLFYLFLAASGLSCGTWDLHWGMWDLSLWCAGISLVVPRGICIEAYGIFRCGARASL